jgi:hypothetical protein
MVQTLAYQAYLLRLVVAAEGMLIQIRHYPEGLVVEQALVVLQFIPEDLEHLVRVMLAVQMEQ